jgi:hypothetical protein
MILTRSCEAQSQLPIRFAERNCTFDVAARIHDANFPRAKARAALSVIDCLALFWKHRLNTGSLENAPAPFSRFYSITAITKKR